MGTINVTDREGLMHTLDIVEGQTVMSALRDRDMVRAECGGLKICSTCHVLVEEGWYDTAGAASEEEVDLIDGTLHYIAGQSRLGCQITFSEELEGLSLMLGPDI